MNLPCPDCGRCPECGTTWCGGEGCPTCPPPDAVCIELACTRAATTTRPVTHPWLDADFADEWVCARHAEYVEVWRCCHFGTCDDCRYDRVRQEGGR